MWTDAADSLQQIDIFFTGGFCASNDEVEKSCLDELQYRPIVWRMHNAPLFRVENAVKCSAHLRVCIDYERELKRDRLSL